MNGAARLTGRGRAALGLGLAALVFARLFGTRTSRCSVGRWSCGRPRASGSAWPAGRTWRCGRCRPLRTRASGCSDVELRPLDGARSGAAAFSEAGAGQVCALRAVTEGGLRVLRGSYELGPLERGVLELGPGSSCARTLRPCATHRRHARQHVADRARSVAGAARGDARQRPRGRPRAAAPAEWRARVARRARAPARRVTARRALALDGASRPLDDEGAGRPRCRSGRRRPGRSRVRRCRQRSRLELRARARGSRGARDTGTCRGQARAAGHRRRRRRAGRCQRACGRPPVAGARTAERRASPRRADRPPGRGAHRGRHDPPRRRRRRRERARLGVVAIDPSSYDPGRRATPGRWPSCDRPVRVCSELRRPEPEPWPRPREPRSRLAWQALLYVLAAGFGMLHARDLQLPALSTPRLPRDRALAPTPALVALRTGRRLGLLALAPASLVAAWLAAGSPPSAGSPLGGLVGNSRTRPRPGSGSCCRSTRTSCRSCARSCCSRCSPGWPGWRGSHSRALGRSPPPARVAPFVRERDGLRLAAVPVARAGRGRAAVRIPVHRPPGRRWRAAGGGFASRWPSAPPPQCLRRPGRPCCRGRPGRSRTRDTRPDVDVVWDMRYQPLSFGPQAGGGAAGAFPASLLLARDRALDFNGLRFTRALQAIVDTRGRGGRTRPGAVAGPTLHAEVQVEAYAAPSWSLRASR